MIPLHQFTQLGSAVERIGRAAAPGSLPASSARPHDAPATPCHSANAGPRTSQDLPVTRSPEEAEVDNTRAREYQREAPTLGAGLGSLIGLILVAWFGRRK